MSSLNTIFKKMDDTPKRVITPKITRGALRKLEVMGELPIKILGRPVESKKFLLVREDSPDVIRDVYYPKQMVSGGDVSVSGEDLFSVMREIRTQGYLFRGWEHVHPPFCSVDPSSTDIENNGVLLAEVPLELASKDYVSCRVRYQGTIIEAETEVSTNYLVCIISPAKVNILERAVERVTASLCDLVEGRSNSRYVEVISRRWSSFFVPQGYARDQTRLDVVEVKDDITYQPETWAEEVKAKTSLHSYRIRLKKKTNLLEGHS